MTAFGNRSVRLDFPGKRYILATVPAAAADKMWEKIGTDDTTVILMDDQITGARVRFRIKDVVVMSQVNSDGGTLNHAHPVYIA